MNRGKGQVTSRLGGYTIVETLIFLAVSAAIFFAAMQLIGGFCDHLSLITRTGEFVFARLAAAVTAGDRGGAVGRATGDFVSRILPMTWVQS